MLKVGRGGVRVVVGVVGMGRVGAVSQTRAGGRVAGPMASEPAGRRRLGRQAPDPAADGPSALASGSQPGQSIQRYTSPSRTSW
jgi:hypothetical protein